MSVGAGWDPKLYLKYAQQRGSAALDLVNCISIQPRTAVDLGCGPGNSTALVHARWPEAKIVGVDNDAAMLERARKDHPGWDWVNSGIDDWQPHEAFDLVFANAALHWVPDHARIFPRLLGFVSAGGALAVQMPQNQHSRVHIILRELASSAGWKSRFTGPIHQLTSHPPEYYYELLSPLAARLDIRETTYHHEMESAQSIIEWFRSAGMRVYLKALSAEDAKAFEAEALREVEQRFPKQTSGKVLLPYPRIFIVAYK
jgi:trans-aconitate 2-methyltransferase